MIRTRLTALALAAALPLTAVHVAEVPLATAQGAATVTLDTTEKRARLAAQAIEELINEYREANGLHPLVTHELYDAQALKWSEQMVADLDDPTKGRPEFDSEGTITFDGAFQHSDMEEWGHSGENIAFQGFSGADQVDWKDAAETFFEIWRNSPDHNANMLRADVQGMGLGLVLNEDTVWGTTMFFINDTPVKDKDGNPAKLMGDKVTQGAIASGKPFYVPEGARALLGVGGVKEPTNTVGYEITYEVDLEELGIYTVVEYTDEKNTGLNKAKNAPRGVDPIVTGKTIKPVAIVPTEATPTPTSPPSILTSAATPTTVITWDETTTPTLTLTGETSSTSEPAPSTAKSTASKPAASIPATTTSKTEPTTSATPTAPVATTTAGKATTTSVVPTTGVEGTVDKQTPSSTTKGEPTSVEKPASADEGSSKAGIAIGVVLGLIAAIGAVVAALPMVAPELAKQLGLR